MRATILRQDHIAAPRRMSTVRRRQSVRHLMRGARGPTVVILNGRPLLRAGWRRRLRDGDVLLLVRLPRGDRGGGSNALAMLATIALIVVVPMVAPGIAGALVPGLGAAGVQLVAGGLMLAGNALISSLTRPEVGRGQDIRSGSPTYSLEAQGNLARIGAPIPPQYGRLKFFPDFAEQPYTEFSGDEQYLLQVLCLGRGEFEIEAILIEDTPVSAFAEIETEIIPPGGEMKLFPSAVVTAPEISGQELTGRVTATWARSGSTVTITRADHGLAAGQAVWLDLVGTGAPAQAVYRIQAVPSASTFTVTSSGVSGSGSGGYAPVVGGESGIIASGAGTEAWRLALDVVLPRGLFRVDGSGNMQRMSLTLRAQARQVDDLGRPIGGWIEITPSGAPLVIEDATVSAIRRSYPHALATKGRYAVRMWRTDTKSSDAQVANDAAWTGLRSYLTDDRRYGDTTCLAMRMRATNNLSAQASRRVAVIATRKLPIWDGEGWSAPVATRDIAPALMDAAMSEYGGRLDLSRIDAAGLLDLQAIWTARGDKIDLRFEEETTLWEALRRIAEVGRARPYWQAGQLRFVRDNPDQTPVMLFTTRGINRGSFTINYLHPTEATADAVTVRYFDARGWTWRTVTGRVTGSLAETPVEVEMRGITDAAQATREAHYLAAVNRYRRRVATFDVPAEGLIPSLGDLIAIQHDAPGWGIGGDTVAWDAVTRTLTIAEPLDDIVGADVVVALRRDDGGFAGLYTGTRGAGEGEIILDADPAFAPHDGGGVREATHVAVGAAAVATVRAKVLSVRPAEDDRIAIEAVLDDPSVHSAETGVTAPPLVISQLDRSLSDMTIRGLSVRVIEGTRAIADWLVVPGAVAYHVELGAGDDPLAADVSWIRAADTDAPHHALTLIYGAATMARVRAIGLTVGEWAYAVPGFYAGFFWGPDADPFWGDDINPFWE